MKHGTAPGPGVAVFAVTLRATGDAQANKPQYTGPGGPGKGTEAQIMLKAIADVLRTIGGAIATIVTLPFRLVARLFGGASESAHGRH